MIDDKKIEEEARYYCNNRYPASQDAPFIEEGFLEKVLAGLSMSS